MIDHLPEPDLPLRDPVVQLQNQVPRERGVRLLLQIGVDDPAVSAAREAQASEGLLAAPQHG